MTTSPATPPVRAIGADGCKGGRWAAFLVDDSGLFRFEVFADTAALRAASGDCQRVLLDVPIGLVNARRECDLAAKRQLGPHHARVFLTPPRAAIEAATWSASNRISRSLGCGGVSKQAWNITPRIREIDHWLREEPKARETVGECHPEICFAALAGTPIAASKKTHEGQCARLTALRPLVPNIDELVLATAGRYPASVLVLDDILDALVCAACAAAPPGERRLLPASHPTPRDECGIPMAMHWRQPSASPPTLMPNRR